MKFRRVSAIVAAFSLMVSAGAHASAAAPAAISAPASAWSALAVMGGAQSAAAYCGATVIGAAGAAAAQGAGGCVLPQLDPVVTQPPQTGVVDVPPPLPGAVAGVSGGGGLSPLLLALGALGAAALAYFIIRGIDKSKTNSPA